MAAFRMPVPVIDRGDASLDRRASETMLVAFLAGQEESAELLVRLGLRNGQSLLQVYEQIRTGINEAIGRPGARSLLGDELDEHLVRLVARLRPPSISRPVLAACILPIQDRGVAACISHLMVEAGMASIVVSAPPGERSLIIDASTVALMPPIVDFAVIDGSRGRPAVISHHLDLVRQLDIVGAETKVIVLADPGCRMDPNRPPAIPGPVVVTSLSELLTALAIAADNPLTGREREVLGLVAAGATNEQIARCLGVAVSTVKTYLERIHAKLKSRDRASAVAAAMLRHWL